MVVQIGAHFLTKQAGGSGVLLGGVPGVPKGKVTIIGGGVVGTHAARIALGLGAQVTIFRYQCEASLSSRRSLWKPNPNSYV